MMTTLVKVILALIFCVACAPALLAQGESNTNNQAPISQEGKSVETKAAVGTPSAVEEAKAIIYFYRTKQFAGSGLEPTVYGDEKELARMDNGRYFGVTVDPGKHTFRMGDKQTGFELDMKSGQVYYARVTIEAGFWKGHGRLTLMQPEQGAFEIKKVKPLGASKVKDRTLVTIYEGSDKQAEAAKNKQ